MRLISASGKNGTQQVMTDLTLENAVTICRKMHNNGFIQSLLRDYDRGQSNGNKNAWIIITAHRANQNTQPAQPRTTVGDFASLISLFKMAGSRLKFPKVTLETTDGRTVELSVAGPNSKARGQITVTNGIRYGDRVSVFFGRIAQDGSTGIQDSGVLDLLRRFAADPAGVAAEYGRRSGNCCFCCQELTDDRSLTVGYGPVCAKNYDLPWGNKRQPAQPVQRELPMVDEPTPPYEDEADYHRDYAARERAIEEAGFASDPDYRLVSFEEVMVRAGAIAVQDGYLIPVRERELVGAGAPWQDND